MIKTWLHNQLRVIRNGVTPLYAVTSISKVVSKHISYIFEEHIADRKLPTIEECEEVRRRHEKIKHLSAADIRKIVKSQFAA